MVIIFEKNFSAVEQITVKIGRSCSRLAARFAAKEAAAKAMGTGFGQSLDGWLRDINGEAESLFFFSEKGQSLLKSIGKEGINQPDSSGSSSQCDHYSNFRMIFYRPIRFFPWGEYGFWEKVFDGDEDLEWQAMNKAGKGWGCPVAWHESCVLFLTVRHLHWWARGITEEMQCSQPSDFSNHPQPAVILPLQNGRIADLDTTGMGRA